jgi:transcriptional regulator with GAF, ATPase, and Fis domain
MENNDTPKLHEQLQDYERLFSVLQTIGSSLEVEAILRQIIDEAIALCHAQQGAILLFDATGEETVKTLIRQGDAKDELLDHYLNTLLSGWILRHKKPQMTDNLAATFGAKQIKAKYHSITSVLSVPLEWHREIIGVINLLSLEETKKFGERELRLMSILASQCAQFIANAKLHEEVFAEARRLRQEVQDKYAFHGIIGHSPKMQAMFALLERVIPTEGRVLLEGESGTGKELVARVIHYGGPRKDGPFVAVDCGALPANLLESELFGYVKGAFTGALRDKKGLFEVANKGTLFLDEIVNMPLEVQAKFLRAIQEGEIRPLGSPAAAGRKVDVRIIAAASGDLRAQMEAGKFRQDLFYRLNVVNVALPPLRERKEDIAILANHFLEKMAEKHGRKITGFAPETMAYLESHAWPGNVRELENVVERMVILAEPKLEQITPELLPSDLRPQNPDSETAAQQKKPSKGVKTMKDAYEKMILLEALVKHHWNQSAAARELEIDEKTVRYKMQKFGIRKP